MGKFTREVLPKPVFRLTFEEKALLSQGSGGERGTKDVADGETQQRDEFLQREYREVPANVNFRRGGSQFRGSRPFEAA